MDLNRYFSLSIDKISFTCNDTNPLLVIKACDRLTDTANGFFSGLQVKSSRWHRVQCALPIPNSSSSFLIQAGPRLPGISDYRFEFNPSVIGPLGIEYARSFINSMIDIGFDTLLADGKVTRMDAALDLVGISLDDVIVRSKKQRVHGVYTNQHSQLETVYLGSAKSNRTVVYNKVKGDFRVLRVERRMKPSVKGHQLVHFTNPFDKVDLISTDSLLPHLDGMVPEQFFDRVRMRGIRNAISGLLPRQRRAIRRTLVDPEESLLPPMPLIWNAWPNVLSGCGLGFLGDNHSARREAAE
jgi:hypothetical protein